MKKILVFIFSVAAMSFTQWQPNFESAKKIAKEKHELTGVARVCD